MGASTLPKERPTALTKSNLSSGHDPRINTDSRKTKKEFDNEKKNSQKTRKHSERTSQIIRRSLSSQPQAGGRIRKKKYKSNCIANAICPVQTDFASQTGEPSAKFKNKNKYDKSELNITKQRPAAFTRTRLSFSKKTSTECLQHYPAPAATASKVHNKLLQRQEGKRLTATTLGNTAPNTKKERKTKASALLLVGTVVQCTWVLHVSTHFLL